MPKYRINTFLSKVRTSIQGLCNQRLVVWWVLLNLIRIVFILLMLTIINTQWCIIKEVTILGRDMREGNNNFGGASNNGIGGRIEARNQQHFVSDSELHRLRQDVYFRSVASIYLAAPSCLCNKYCICRMKLFQTFQKNSIIFVMPFKKKGNCFQNSTFYNAFPLFVWPLAPPKQWSPTSFCVCLSGFRFTNQSSYRQPIG